MVHIIAKLKLFIVLLTVSVSAVADDNYDVNTLTEQQCQEIYRLNCDRVVNWLKYAKQACTRDTRCNDMNFLERKYKPVSQEKLREIAIRNSARKKSEERKLRLFLKKRYTDYCEQQAGNYCKNKINNADNKLCRSRMIAACKDERDIEQVLLQYNHLTPVQREEVLELVDDLEDAQTFKTISTLLNDIVDLLILKKIGL